MPFPIIRPFDESARAIPRKRPVPASVQQVLARCIAEGLVGGNDFGVDASLIKADDSRYAKVELADWSMPDQVSRATQEYLDTPETMRLLVARRRCSQSPSLRLIRRPAIPAPTVTGRSLPVPPTIWSIWTMPSSLMWMRQRRSVKPKSRSPRR